MPRPLHRWKSLVETGWIAWRVWASTKMGVLGTLESKSAGVIDSPLHCHASDIILS